MTEAESKLVEAALNWRRIHGPATDRTSSAMTDVATHAEAVIRERNRAGEKHPVPCMTAREAPTLDTF